MRKMGGKKISQQFKKRYTLYPFYPKESDVEFDLFRFVADVFIYMYVWRNLWFYDPSKELN